MAADSGEDMDNTVVFWGFLTHAADYTTNRHLCISARFFRCALVSEGES